MNRREATILDVQARFGPGTGRDVIPHGKDEHPEIRGNRSVISLVSGEFAHLRSDAIDAVRKEEKDRTSARPRAMFEELEHRTTARIPRVPATDRLPARMRPYPTGGAA